MSIDREPVAPPAPRGADTIGLWLTQRRSLIALLRNDDYRRDLISLFIRNLHAIAGWKFVATLLILACGGLYLVFAFGDSISRAYDILQIIFGVAAIGGGASLYSAEREAGTFELLWLATGSERILIRLKMMTMLLALTVLVVPTVLAVSLLTTNAPPAPQTIFFLTVNTFLILALMTYVSTFLPQSWAGGFVGAAILAAIYVTLRSSVSPFSPFRNPFVEMPAPSMAMSAVNRVFVILLSFFFVDAAARRLRRSF